VNRSLIVAGAILASLCIATTAQVTTQHNDASRTGQNVAETILAPGNVNANQFGKLTSISVDGFVAAQPLYLPGVTLADSSVHNVVYVATMHDSVYAVDAQTGAILWTRSLLPSFASTVPIKTAGCPETGFVELGILGTPVIDPSSNTMYVVANTWENGTGVFRMYAMDVTTGLDKIPAAVITGSFLTGSGAITFNPNPQHQRPGLLLANGNVYVAFGSNGCDYGATGWVMAYGETTLQQTAVYNIDSDQSFGGSIWQSGMGLAADSSGNLFFATANGTLNTGTGDYGESVVRLTGSLSVTDYFSPYINAYLNDKDFDLGSGGVLLLPDQPGFVPHLLIAAGKEGTVYLLNRDNLGQFSSDQDAVVQTIPAGVPEVGGGGTGAAFWNNNIYYATTGGLRMFTLSNGALTPVTIPSGAKSVSGKGLPSVSANGSTNGLVWILRGLSYSAPILTAYNANTMAMIYQSTTAANGRDTVTPIAHFATPTIANGHVFIGTQSQLLIYGLLPQLKVWYGYGQSAKAGTALPKSLEVRAVDGYSGAVQPNVSVTFTDNGAGGSFNPASAMTNASGIAVTSYTLPATPGTVKVSGTAAGFANATFSETAQ
jgi:hypothetical protein